LSYQLADGNLASCFIQLINCDSCYAVALCVTG